MSSFVNTVDNPEGFQHLRTSTNPCIRGRLTDHNDVTTIVEDSRIRRRWEGPLRRWYLRVRDYLKAQVDVMLGVTFGWLRGIEPANLADHDDMMETPGASCPCDAGHLHYDRQHARICNELEAHSLGFFGAEVLASMGGEDG